ncbi:MAG: hypothetical protein ABIN89_16350 [Chitinophagaceae bacterium]
MKDQELVDNFISFIKKQLHFGSSTAPLLYAMIDQYTSYENEKETLIAGLNKLNAVKIKNGVAKIDMDKIPKV